MKTIQWYPGHMAKAMRMMRENLSLADGVIFVLDARCPASSFNPKLKELAGAKPLLYALNKGDLADGGADRLLDIIRRQGAQAVKLNSLNGGSKRDILGAMEKIVAEKRQKALERGYMRTFRFMVAGVPNTGKSTLINLLAGGRRAETGDKAGVTRGKQTLAARLAFVGSINDDILDLDDIVLLLLEELGQKYPQSLAARYGIEGGSPADMLDAVCQKRGFKLRGGEYDYDRAVRAVLDDFRKGRLGRITFDLPPSLSE